MRRKLLLLLGILFFSQVAVVNEGRAIIKDQSNKYSYGSHLAFAEDLLVSLELLELANILFYLEKDSIYFDFLPEVMKFNKEVLSVMIRKDYHNFTLIPKSLQENESYVVDLIKVNPFILKLDFPLKDSSSFQNEITNSLRNAEIIANLAYDYQSYLKLLSFSDYVSDDGNTLNLRLQNGEYKSIEYTPYVDDDKSFAVKLLDYWQDLGFYVVQYIFYEGYGVYLFDDITGERLVNIHKFPAKFSPNRNYIVFAQSVDAFGFSGTEIFEISPNHVESIYQEEGYGYDFVRWVDNESFLLNQWLLNGGMFMMKKDGDSWKYMGWDDDEKVDEVSQ